MNKRAAQAYYCASDGRSAGRAVATGVSGTDSELLLTNWLRGLRW
jgi:hypothetical protein